MAKINIIKVTADGEQVSVDGDFTPEGPTHIKRLDGVTEIKPPRPMLQQLAPYFQLLDDRLFEMNCRILASNELVRRLSPDAQYAIHNVMEVLMGKASKSDIDKLVKEGQERKQKELAERIEKEKANKGPTSH